MIARVLRTRTKLDFIMPAKYHVFLGAPSASDLEIERQPDAYQWHTVPQESPATPRPSWSLPPATLDAASRRISSIYQNTIFQADDNEEEYLHADMDQDVDLTGLSAVKDHSTQVTWPPTQSNSQHGDLDFADPNISFLPTYPSISRVQSRVESQFTQETTYNYSEASSVTSFPMYNFTPSKLTSLSSLSQNASHGQRKIDTLVAVLEVEGPDTVRIKKGPDAGKDVSILKMIIGDEHGGLGKLTAWREVADAWGGREGVRRGDIVLLQNVQATCVSTSSTPTITASPYLKPGLEICYRTMPHAPEDARLRPDLRLGRSDAAVRKVEAVVSWFEKMVGLPRA